MIPDTFDLSSVPMKRRPLHPPMSSRTGRVWSITFQLVVHNVLEDGGEGIKRHGAEVAVCAVARGDGTGFDIAVADDEHIRDLLHLRVADLLADLLAAGVDRHAVALRGELCGLLLAVVNSAVRDRQEADLLRRHPRGQRTGIRLDQVGQRALVAAKARSVDDIRQLLLAVFIGVVHAEALSQQHIDLDGDEGVLLAVDVLYWIFSFGP